MSLAKERLNNILLELPKYESQWESNIVLPYSRAYDLAIYNLNKVTKEQEARDKLKAELFVMSASILTGSVMMAAFATTSLRVLAGRAALHVICNNNLNRTFEAMRAASANKALMFAFGSVLDEAKKLAGKQVTSAVEGLVSSASIASAPTGLNFESRMKTFVNDNHICVHSFVQGVRDDGSLKDDDKMHIAELATKMPFCNPPQSRRIDENRLSQKMELLFYMDAVLESDKLVTYAPASGERAMGRDVEYGSKPISQMPSAANYPKAIAPKFTGRPFSPYDPGQRVEYNNIGSAVRERIDMLSRMTGNSSFYPEQNFAERLLIDPTGNAQMVRAEQIINRLSASARPKDITDVRMM